MERDNPHEWRANNISPEDNILTEVQEGSFQIIDSGKDEEYCVQTPEQKLGLQDGFRDQPSETYLSSCSLNSDLSTKEGPGPMSSSSSSSDAELGASKLPMQNYFLQQVDGDEGLQPKNLEAEEDTFHMLYEELPEKVASNKAELKFAKTKLESSQEEIARLKYENLTLVEELGRTIEKLRTSEDNMEKMEDKLRKKFQEDQHELQNQLYFANKSIDQLQAELGSERKLVSELQQMILKATNDLTGYGHKIDDLELALHDTQEEFSKERSKFQFDITHLVEEKDAIEARVKVAELKNKSLVDQIQQYEAKETGLLTEIKQLSSDLSQKCEAVDSLNKNLDASKLSYDMLVIQKDQVFAQVQTLTAEVTNRDISIKQMGDQLVAEIQKAERQVEELRVKVMDQDKELKRQVSVISDRAEEKREAIRQLCLSLEYYRNGYHELRLAFSKNSRSPVLAT